MIYNVENSREKVGFFYFPSKQTKNITTNLLGNYAIALSMHLYSLRCFIRWFYEVFFLYNRHKIRTSIHKKSSILSCVYFFSISFQESYDFCVDLMVVNLKYLCREIHRLVIGITTSWTIFRLFSTKRLVIYFQFHIRFDSNSQLCQINRQFSQQIIFSLLDYGKHDPTLNIQQLSAFYVPLLKMKTEKTTK